MCIGVIFFIFIFMWIHWSCISMWMFFLMYVEFGPLFLQIFLVYNVGLFFWGLNYFLPRLLDIVSWVAQPLLFFSIDYFKSHLGLLKFRRYKRFPLCSLNFPIKTWALCKFWMLDNFLLTFFLIIIDNWKKMHNLKVGYVLFGGQNWGLKPRTQHLR